MPDPAVTLADMYRADQYLPAREVLDGEAYLVSRGVRPLALVGHCPGDSLVMLRVRTALHQARQAELVLPFIFPERPYEDGEPSAAFGYAAHRWVIDCLEWALTADIPKARRHELVGLLCGYSPAAIARHQEQEGLWSFE